MCSITGVLSIMSRPKLRHRVRKISGLGIGLFRNDQNHSPSRSSRDPPPHARTDHPCVIPQHALQRALLEPVVEFTSILPEKRHNNLDNGRASSREGVCQYGVLWLVAL